MSELGDQTARESSEAEFSMEEHAGSPEGTRLALVGELDLAGVDQLHARLQTLAKRGAPVVLDLRRLQFIDSTGLGELVRAVSDARRDAWTLEIDRGLSPQVRQVIELLELQHIFWPGD
jgi:anti-anti-sigma factor